MAMRESSNNADLWVQIQARLVAPKGQMNTFGKYKYRSTEDILEALKPLLAELGCSVLLDDELIMVGNRFYVKTAASLMKDGMAIATAFGYAREPEEKKGMDSSQITGATSSYARKYALCGLLAIDDNKDADAAQYLEPDKKPLPAKPAQVPYEIKDLGKTQEEKLKETPTPAIKEGEKVDPRPDLVAIPIIREGASGPDAEKADKETILCPKKGSTVYKTTCTKCTHLAGCPAMDGVTMNLFNHVLPDSEEMATGDRYDVDPELRADTAEFNKLANTYMDRDKVGSAKTLDIHIAKLQRTAKGKGKTINEIKAGIFTSGSFEKLWRAYTQQKLPVA